MQATGSATDTFDYVIVGAGSAGCVLAARLSEDPAVSVCLLEAGGSDRDPLIRVPLGIALLVPRRDPQLGVQDDAAAGPRRPPRLSAARQDAGRQQLDQRDGLHPRPSQRLRRVGGARQRGLVLCRRAAVFPPGGEQRAHRRRLSRAGRSAQCRRSALALRVLGALARGRGAAGHEAQRGLQRRGAGRGRALSADAEERRALERRARLSRRRTAAGPTSRCARGRTRRASCSRTSGRSGIEYRQGGAARDGARAARGDPRRRRAAVAAIAAAVGRRRRGGAARASASRPSSICRASAATCATTSISSSPTSRRART